MVSFSSDKLKEVLVKQGLIDGPTFDSLDAEAKRKRQDLVEILVSRGFISKDYLYSLIAESLGIPRFNLREQKIDEGVLQLLPEDVARRRKVIIFSRSKDGALQAAMEDPTDLETLDFLKLRLGAEIQPFLATDEELNKGFSLYAEKLTQDFKKIIESSIKESLRSRARGDTEEAASDLPIVAIVDNLLAYAFSSRASDIHFEVLDDVILVRFRVDGVLHEVIRMPKEVHTAVVARIKILSNLRVDEHTHPQDGRFRHKVGEDFVDVRVSIIPTFYGEKIELRLLAAAQKPLSLKEIGMSDDTIKIVQEAIKKIYGMVLVCGPTGSGKTTTLYSIMNILNKPEVNIITIEDPVEYDMRYVNQVQVNTVAGIAFANGLRSILRQDPNIIMVGEIRDKETANIAVQAALTGHLMLSSLHTNDAVTTIPRLIDMGIPPFLVAAVLNAVSAQRLARRIHLECIESYVPEKGVIETIKNTLKEFGINSEDYKLPQTFYRGRGCNACNHTGYYGRIGLFEAFEITEAVRKAIIDPNFGLDNLRRLAREQGMVSIFEDGLRKAEKGLTTIDELFRVIRE